MNRRAYLATAAGLATVTLAGCSTASGSVPAPVVAESELADGGWEQTDDVTETVFEREFGGEVSVSATAHTLTYEHAELRADLKEKTLGNVDFAPASFFATRVNFAPNIDNLPAGVGLDPLLAETTTNAKQTFRDRLADMGLTKVTEESETTLDIDTGETADVIRFGAVYPFEDISFQLTDEKSLTLEGGELPVDGWLAVWHHGEYVLLAGGGYPAENFARTFEQELSSGIDVTVDIDLELEPETYRAALLSLVAAVE